MMRLPYYKTSQVSVPSDMTNIRWKDMIEYISINIAKQFINYDMVSKHVRNIKDNISYTTIQTLLYTLSILEKLNVFVTDISDITISGDTLIFAQCSLVYSLNTPMDSINSLIDILPHKTIYPLKGINHTKYVTFVDIYGVYRNKKILQNTPILYHDHSEHYFWMIFNIIKCNYLDIVSPENIKKMCDDQPHILWMKYISKRGKPSVITIHTNVLKSTILLAHLPYHIK